MKATKPVDLENLEKRRPIRLFLQWLAKVAFALLTNLEVEGQENFLKP